MNVNWKKVAAAFTSMLTMLAMVPYDLYQGSLKQFADVVPSSWKPTIVLVGLGATLALRTWAGITTEQPK